MVDQEAIDRTIADLVSDCDPVQPISPPGKRAVILTSLAILWSVTIVALLGTRDLATTENRWFWSLEMGILVITGAFGIWCALSLAIPGSEVGKPWRWVWYGLAAWAGVLVTGGIHAALATDQCLLPLQLSEFMCVFWITIFTIGPAALLAHTVQKGFPTCRREVAMVIMLTGSVWSTLGIELYCTHESAQHHLLFHFAPVIAAAIIGWVLGRRLLRPLAYSFRELKPAQQPAHPPRDE